MSRAQWILQVTRGSFQIWCPQFFFGFFDPFPLVHIWIWIVVKIHATSLTTCACPYRRGRGSWKSACSKGGCVNFLLQFRSKCGQGGKGTPSPSDIDIISGSSPSPINTSILPHDPLVLVGWAWGASRRIGYGTRATNDRSFCLTDRPYWVHCPCLGNDGKSGGDPIYGEKHTIWADSHSHTSIHSFVLGEYGRQINQSNSLIDRLLGSCIRPTPSRKFERQHSHSRIWWLFFWRGGWFCVVVEIFTILLVRMS